MALGNWPALSWVLAVLKLPTSNFSLFFATVKISIIHLVTKACRKLGLWYFSAASLHSNSYKLLRTSFMFLSHILESVTSPFPIVIWNLVPFRNESISANHPPPFFFVLSSSFDALPCAFASSLTALETCLQFLSIAVLILFWHLNMWQFFRLILIKKNNNKLCSWFNFLSPKSCPQNVHKMIPLF